jgi:hypothetical protein
VYPQQLDEHDDAGGDADCAAEQLGVADVELA